MKKIILIALCALMPLQQMHAEFSDDSEPTEAVCPELSEAVHQEPTATVRPELSGAIFQAQLEAVRSGRRSSSKKWKKIAAALGISVGALLGIAALVARWQYVKNAQSGPGGMPGFSLSDSQGGRPGMSITIVTPPSSPAPSQPSGLSFDAPPPPHAQPLYQPGPQGQFAIPHGLSSSVSGGAGALPPPPPGHFGRPLYQSGSDSGELSDYDDLGYGDAPPPPPPPHGQQLHQLGPRRPFAIPHGPSSSLSDGAGALLPPQPHGQPVPFDISAAEDRREQLAREAAESARLEEQRVRAQAAEEQQAEEARREQLARAEAARLEEQRLAEQQAEEARRKQRAREAAEEEQRLEEQRVRAQAAEEQQAEEARREQLAREDAARLVAKREEKERQSRSNYWYSLRAYAATVRCTFRGDFETFESEGGTPQEKEAAMVVLEKEIDDYAAKNQDSLPLLADDEVQQAKSDINEYQEEVAKQQEEMESVIREASQRKPDADAIRKYLEEGVTGSLSDDVVAGLVGKREQVKKCRRSIAIYNISMKDANVGLVAAEMAQSERKEARLKEEMEQNAQETAEVEAQLAVAAAEEAKARREQEAADAEEAKARREQEAADAEEAEARRVQVEAAEKLAAAKEELREAQGAGNGTGRQGSRRKRTNYDLDALGLSSGLEATSIKPIPARRVSRLTSLSSTKSSLSPETQEYLANRSKKLGAGASAALTRWSTTSSDLSTLTRPLWTSRAGSGSGGGSAATLREKRAVKRAAEQALKETSWQLFLAARRDNKRLSRGSRVREPSGSESREEFMKLSADYASRLAERFADAVGNQEKA